jgi:hypothetical protein
MVAGNATHDVEHRKIDEVMALGSWLLAHSYGADFNGATLWQCFFWCEGCVRVSKARVERWV